MKKKFSKIFGVGLVGVLAISLMMVAAPPQGSEVAASPDVTFRLSDQADGFGTACWDTTPVPHAGTYSVELVHTVNAGSIYVEFVPDPGVTLADLDDIGAASEWSFWHNTPAVASNWAQLELKFEDPCSVGFVDVTLMPLQGFTGTGAWVKETVLATSERAIYYGQDEAGAGIAWDNVGVFGLDDMETEIDADILGTSGNWELTRVRMELWEGIVRTCHIDDVTIDGITYDVERGPEYWLDPDIAYNVKTATETFTLMGPCGPVVVNTDNTITWSVEKGCGAGNVTIVAGGIDGGAGGTNYITVRMNTKGDAHICAVYTPYEGGGPKEACAEKKWGEIYCTELTKGALVNDECCVTEYVEASFLWDDCIAEVELPADNAVVDWWLMDIDALAAVEALEAELGDDPCDDDGGCGGYVPDFFEFDIDASGTIEADEVFDSPRDAMLAIYDEFDALPAPNAILPNTSDADDTHEQTTTGVDGKTAVTVHIESPNSVILVTLTDYPIDKHGQNTVCVQHETWIIVPPPPPAQVKIPQVRWAGEKIVIEKDFGDLGFDPATTLGRVVTFTVDQDSIGALAPIIGYGEGNYVLTYVMDDGVARVIFESEYEGQAEIKCVLYDCPYTHAGSETRAILDGCIPIDNHDFPIYYLKLESIEPLDDSPDPVDTFDDVLFGVQVKGWFKTKSSELSSRPAKCIDTNPLLDALPNVANGGNGIPDDDCDIILPAGRWVLPDDWPTLAGLYELRRWWDLMNNWEDQVILSTVHPWGPYDGGVETTTLPGLAEAPVIGPFNTTQPVAIEDEVIKWVTTASVIADYTVAFPWLIPPVGALLPGAVSGASPTWDWTVADLRNTVVPDGMIEWFDCPMSPAKVIFQVAEDQLDDPPGDLFNAWKFAMEPYSQYDLLANSGTATADATNFTTLTDSTQAWTVDALIDEWVYIWSAGTLYRRVITDNTATGLTFTALPTMVDAGDTYYLIFGVWYAPFYDEEIPSHWFIPVGSVPVGYNWDSWGEWTLPAPGILTGPLDDSPYPFWLDLGLTTTVPATDDEVIEVYSDNNGRAYVGMSALGEQGEVRIHAKADYPYMQGKHPPLVSKEVTQTWGPVELNPHFVADEIFVLVGDTVTFDNLTAGGTHPYTRAAWDFDADGVAEIVIEGTEAQVMADVTWEYTAADVYTVRLTMTDSTPTTRDEDRDDYITVTGDGAMKGDCDSDTDIDFTDFVAFVAAYGSVSTDLNYNECADFDDDNDVDFTDFVAFAAVYGFGT